MIRTGFGIVFIDQSGITTPFTLPQFPFIQNDIQKTQDSINPAFKLSSGPTITPIALTPTAGLGQSVYTTKFTAGSGYVEQWNLGVQRQVTQNLSIDMAYVGSHIVHVGIPDSNFNQLTAAQIAVGLTNPTSLTAQVNQPVLRHHPRIKLHRRQDRCSGAAAEAVPRVPERRHLPQQLRHDQLQRLRVQGRAARPPRDSICWSLTRTRS